MEKIFREIKRTLGFEQRDFLDFPAHIHEEIELVFVKRGGGIAYCDGKKYQLAENSVFLIFPNQVHQYDKCVKGEYVILIIRPSELFGYNKVFAESMPASAILELQEESGENILYLLENALKEFKEDGYSIITAAYLTALFGKLFKLYKLKNATVSSDTVSQILQYCTAHYKENITVEDVADKLHLSRSSVSHTFSNRLSISFCDYINSLRLNDAVYLLKNKNYPITEIADMSGFPTIRTFNRAFLKKYGVSPSVYKKL